MANGRRRYRTPTTGLTRKRVEAIIRPVIEAHQHLALDSQGDREALILALLEALA